MNSKVIVPKMNSVRVEGVKAIVGQLGIGKAAFFLRENMSQDVDYLELKEQMFGSKTAREIYQEIKGRGQSE